MASRPLYAGAPPMLLLFVPTQLPPPPMFPWPFVPVPVPAPPHAAPFVAPVPHAAAAVQYYGGGVVCLPAMVKVRSITAVNLDEQMDLIRSLLPRFPYVAVDTEYPGTVHRPAAGRRYGQLAPDERYALMKANVDELPIVQLGVTLCDAQGNLPVVLDEQHRPVELAWEVNFSDFDVSRDRHAAESVAFLRSQGFYFSVARAAGVSSTAFRDKLLGVLSSRPRDELTWAAFGGLYDFGYLVKLLTGGQPLPATKKGLLAQVRAHLGRRVFDAKYMAEHCGRGDLRGVGLKGVAGNLGVPAAFPEPPYLAGAKSILACRIFTVMRRHVFYLDGGACHEGHIDGLQ